MGTSRGPTTMRYTFAVFVFALAFAAAACSRTTTGVALQANPSPEPASAAANVSTDRPAATPRQAGDSYYVQAAEAVARRAADRKVGEARNLILFVGDGMGVSTLTAARIYAGQRRGLDGESFRLAMDQMPHLALAKTYSHNGQVSDSAATATAMVAGVKTNLRTLGVTQAASFSNCASLEGNTTDTLFELAERAGLSTGIVSTARITHATPASAYAKTPHRDWEDDTAFDGAVPETCKDISSQFIGWNAGDGFEIAMGGGRRHFLPADLADPEYPEATGRRGDGRNLMTEWSEKSESHVVVTDRAGFDALDFNTDIRVLGLFEPSHMQYELDRDKDPAGEPSLAELTRAAITRLSRDEDGYVLMVEAGRIDHAHHGTNAARALADTEALDEAVAAALEMTDADDTLIIVTADHSHTLTMAGYPARGNPILGLAAFGPGGIMRGADGKPYTTLGYANGPSAPCFSDGEDSAPDEPCARRDLSGVDTAAKDFRQPALVPMPSETHAGEDVPIFARGPGANLVSGVMEQHEIFHVMGLASGLVAPDTPEPASAPSTLPEDDLTN